MPTDERIMPVQNLGWGFSRNEVMHLWIGIIIMTFAFALAYIGGALKLSIYFNIGGFSLVFLIILGSFVAVVTAFFLHEFAHKGAAQRYGAVAEYRDWPAGLVAGLVTGAGGVMLAFPGAVVITGRVTPRQQMVISVAGPITNIACSALFVALSILLGTAPGRLREPIPLIVGAIAFVNLLLAGFSLVPVPAIAVRVKLAKRFPIKVTVPASDGYLVWVSSRPVWGISVAALVALGIGARMLGVF